MISHDVAAVHHLSRRVGVMCLGKLVEVAGSDALYENARHPYTQMLLAASPTIEVIGQRPRTAVRGEIPNAVDPPSGCRFRPRCPSRSTGVRWTSPRCARWSPATG